MAISRKIVEVPENGDYSDSAYARLYGTFVSFGLTETRLIWTRYAGFLVLQGFVVNTVSRSHVVNGKVIYSIEIEPLSVLILCLLGIVLSVVWHILNFSGWLNQNIWYRHAAGIHFKGLNIPTPTDWWIDEDALRPTGLIYCIAQLVPIVLMIIYFIITIWSISKLGVSLCWATVIAIVAAFLSWFILNQVESREFKKRTTAEEKRKNV